MHSNKEKQCITAVQYVRFNIIVSSWTLYIF